MVADQPQGVQEEAATEVHDNRLRRLYAYWLEHKGDRRFPSRRDIDPTDFSYLLGDVMLVDVLRNPLRFKVRLHGTNLVDRGKRVDLTGKFLDELPADERWEYLSQRCEGLVRTGKPIAIRYERIWDWRKCRYEALWLPFSDDDTNVAMLLCAIDYRLVEEPEGLKGSNGDGR